MNIITSYNIDDVFKNIKIKKPVNFNNKSILNLYNNKDEPIIFQSPVLYLPNNYIYDDTSIKKLDLCEYNSNKFLTFMNLLFHKIINRINNYDNTLFNNKTYYPNILSSIHSNKFIRFKEIYLSQLNIYDINNNPIDIQKIKTESKIKCIFMLRSVWINSEHYGFKLNLLQIQHKEFTNNINLFKTSTDNIITNNLMPPPPPPPTATSTSTTCLL
jgi:hypothetical protein